MRLKAKLGPDAVIVKTNRGEDNRGRYVEIAAMPAPSAEDDDEHYEVVETPAPRAPQSRLAAGQDRRPPPAGVQVARDGRAPAVRETRESSDEPALGGRMGASAAYARVARTVGGGASSAARPQDDPPVGDRWARIAAQHGQAPARAPAPSAPAPNPFAERAALLARQVTAPAIAQESQERVRDDLATLRNVVEKLERRPQADSQATGVSEATLERVAGELGAQIRELRGMLGAQPDPRDSDRLPRGVRILRDRLVAVGINALHAADICRRLNLALDHGTPDDADVLARVGRELARDMPCLGDPLPQPGRPRILAFVGPTGVGKTTTIAKIAANAQLVRKLKVGLITVDTFRMAAVEQLARYAEILECPLQVVKQPEELAQALDAMADCDLILVDTTGRSPRAADQVAALGQYFPSGWGGEVILTVAASTRERDLHAAIEAFGVLDYSALCVTKLDETDALGVVYSAARRAGRPLSWLTAGQRVPEDLEVAETALLAARIVTRSAATPLVESALAG